MFFTEHITNEDYRIYCFAWKIIDIYIKAYLSSFISEQELRINNKQGQLYKALSKTAAKQREDLAAKERQIQHNKIENLKKLYNEKKLTLLNLAHSAYSHFKCNKVQ